MIVVTFSSSQTGNSRLQMNERKEVKTSISLKTSQRFENSSLFISDFAANIFLKVNVVMTSIVLHSLLLCFTVPDPICLKFSDALQRKVLITVPG